MRLTDAVLLSSGSPRSRITESPSDNAPMYYFYDQNDLEEDLSGIKLTRKPKGLFRTNDPVATVTEGDLVFSLISGKAAIVQPWHDGCLITQNYAKLFPTSKVDPAFLAFLLNESDEIRRQLQTSQQGSVTLKYTIKQLSDLQLPDLPSPKRQKTIGSLYFSQLKLAALIKRLAESKTTLSLSKLKEATKDE